MLLACWDQLSDKSNRKKDVAISRLGFSYLSVYIVLRPVRMTTHLSGWIN